MKTKKEKMIAIVIIAFVAILALISENDINLDINVDKKDIAGAQNIEDIKDLYYVNRVIDGDTIVVEKQNEEYRVRMIGIDTPETVHPQKPIECFGQEASEKLKTLIQNKHVELIPDPTQDDKDRYNRLLRYVYLDKSDINLLMIEKGYAFEYTYRIPYEKQDSYKEAERYAREGEIGLWDPEVCDY